MREISKAIRVTVVLVMAYVSVTAQTPDQAHWPQWRGPFFNGMARGDAPTNWNDTTNIKWKTEIPGKGLSTPVIWGDRIFLTTAIPTGKPAAAAPTPAPAATSTPPGGQGGGRQGRGPGGDTGPQAEQRFEVLCLDRKTGKILWQKTARVATPHEGYHRVYGSFASNSPVTDGKYVYAFFGSRGIYAYDFNGKLVWEKDFGVQMKIKNGFGEGSAPLLDGNRLFLLYDHEAGSFMVALERSLGAAVGFYGGGIVTGRFPQFPTLVDRVGELQTPWLGLFGDEDPSIPVADVEALRTALEGVPVDSEIVRYAGAGHGFHCDVRNEYHKEASADAWTRTLDWFARHLA
jgi:hypothetical protein